MKQYSSVNELVQDSQELVGKTFGEIDKLNLLDNTRNKGNFGQIVETGYYGKPLDNKSQADFYELGVELKTTPVKKIKNNQLSAKERLVLNIIDYMTLPSETFEDSSFLKKSTKMLLVFYLWEQGKLPKDFKIINVFLHQFSESDWSIIREDWTIIYNKVKNGQAHELSESDTTYLSACTKGANRESTREQPFSPIRAKQRAFSLKSAYMTALIRKITDPNAFETITSHNTSLEDVLSAKLSPYFNNEIKTLINQFNLSNVQAKQRNQMLASRMLGIKKNSLSDIEEFAKANIQLKTIKLNKNGMPKEDMSFKHFSFIDILKETWDGTEELDYTDKSQVNEFFSNTQFLLFITQIGEDKVERFVGYKLWKVPGSVLENEIRSTWEETIRTINTGVLLLNDSRGRQTNNLPGKKFNHVCHVRPKAKNSKDTYPLPDGREMTKQGFWLDKKYIKSILEN